MSKDFVIEKNVPMKKYWALPEHIKNLVELLQVGDSFSFPITNHLQIKRLLERKQKDWGKKFAIRKIAEDKYRIWRTF